MSLPQLFLHNEAATGVVTELMEAVDDNKYKNLDYMLGYKKWLLTVNDQDIKGYTALMKAAMKGRTEMVKRLLKVPGIDLEAEETGARLNAVELAYKYKHKDIVPMLLEAMGITPRTINEVERQGRFGPTGTRLHSAVHLNKPIMVTILLNVDGMKVDQQNAEGRTALFDAVDHHYMDDHRVTIVKMLLSKGANPTHKFKKDGTTVLMRAILSKSTKVKEVAFLIINAIKKLQEQGVRVNWDARDEKGWTATAHAEIIFHDPKNNKDVAKDMTEIIDALYKAGAKVGRVTPDFQIPNFLKKKK